jgi:hypothetical protein
VRHADLLGHVHAATRRLLSVTQGGVKYGNTLCLSQDFLPRQYRPCMQRMQKLKKPSSDAVDDGLLLILSLLNHPPLIVS